MSHTRSVQLPHAGRRAARTTPSGSCRRGARQSRRGIATAAHGSEVRELTDGSSFAGRASLRAPSYARGSRTRRRRLVRPLDVLDVSTTTKVVGEFPSYEATEPHGSLGRGDAVNANEITCVVRTQHGLATDITGRNLANSSSLLLSAATLASWHVRRSDGETRCRGGTAGLQHRSHIHESRGAHHRPRGIVFERQLRTWRPAHQCVAKNHHLVRCPCDEIHFKGLGAQVMSERTLVRVLVAGRPAITRS